MLVGDRKRFPSCGRCARVVSDETSMMPSNSENELVETTYSNVYVLFDIFLNFRTIEVIYDSFIVIIYLVKKIINITYKFDRIEFNCLYDWIGIMLIIHDILKINWRNIKKCKYYVKCNLSFSNEIIFIEIKNIKFNFKIFYI